MNTTRPEAEIEYSRGQQASSGGFARRQGVRGRGHNRHFSPSRWGLTLAGLSGAALLVAAEFTPLITIRARAATSAGEIAIKTVQTGSHHTYALLLIAPPGAFLTLEGRRGDGWVASAAIGVLGLVALLIALLGDLPDARATGLVGSGVSDLRVAHSTPSTGLYLETLGAVLLLITAFAGLMVAAAAVRRPGLPRRLRRRCAHQFGGSTGHDHRDP